MSYKPTVVKADNYTFTVNLGRIDIEKNGEPWISNFDGPGTKALIALIFKAAELEDLVKNSSPLDDQV